MDYQYPNKLIDLGVQNTMRHHKFKINNDITGWYILLSRIRSRSGLRWEVGPDPVQNRTGSVTLQYVHGTGKIVTKLNDGDESLSLLFKLHCREISHTEWKLKAGQNWPFPLHSSSSANFGTAATDNQRHLLQNLPESLQTLFILACHSGEDLYILVEKPTFISHPIYKRHHPSPYPSCDMTILKVLPFIVQAPFLPYPPPHLYILPFCCRCLPFSHISAPFSFSFNIFVPNGMGWFMPTSPFFPTVHCIVQTPYL